MLWKTLVIAFCNFNSKVIYVSEGSFNDVNASFIYISSSNHVSRKLGIFSYGGYLNNLTSDVYDTLLCKYPYNEDEICHDEVDSGDHCNPYNETK